MSEQEPAVENLEGAPEGGAGRPRWILWVGLGILTLAFLGICGALVITLDLIPSTDQPTAIPSPLPSQSSIAIDQPGQGATVDVSQALEVSGVGSGLFEGSVVLQAYDAQSNLLAEASTVIDSPDGATGGSGPWSVTLNLSPPSDPEGLIFAFSTSPVDGSITASSSVEVAYVDPSAGEPAIVIVTPNNGSTVDITEPITVAGGAVGLFENNVVVRALDETGKVLAEQATTVDVAEPGGAGGWTASLTIRVTAGTAGRIIAFSPSPEGNSLNATDEIAVTFGVAPTATPGPTATATSTPVPSTLTITEPTKSAVVPIGQGFTVSGTGSNLFENNVVVRAYDKTGNVLAEQATILDTESLGGSGTWSVTLTVQIAAGTYGHITAFSPSPLGGQQPTASSIPVTYGRKPSEQASLMITFPTHPSVVDANALINVTGNGEGLFENNVVVQAVDWEGNVLASTATTLDASEPGGSGSWSAQLSVSLEQPMPGLIVAFSPSATGAVPDAYDGVGVIFNVLVAVPPIAPAPTQTVEPTATSSG